jgi:tetratricopeptide (TPR) repeat protein
VLCSRAADQADQYAAHGLELLEAKRYHEAVAALQQAVNLKPGNPHYMAALGQACLGDGETKSSIRWLEKALKFLPTDFALRFTLALAYQKAEDDSGALRVLSGPVPGDRMAPSWMFLRGFSLFRAQQYDEADALFSALLRYADMRAPADFFLANCRFAKGRLEDSLPLYEEAIRLGNVPSNKALNAYYYNYGLALFRLQRFEPAGAAFGQSIDRFPRDPLPWLFLARCQAELGRPQQAIGTYETLLKDHPDFSPAYYQLARLHAWYGSGQRARELFQKVAALKDQERDQAEQLSKRLMVGR